MGRVDMARQRLNVIRMRMLGAEVRPGRLRHRHAQGRPQRGDPRLGHERARHPLRHRLGGGPGALPGDRRRAAVGDRRRGARADAGRGGAPARRRVVACVGGGSNAIGIFRAFLDDAERGADGRRGRRRGHRDAAATARRWATAHPGVLHGTLLVPAAEPGGPGHRAALDLGRASTTPASGPEHSFLRDSGRVRYVSATDAEALRGVPGVLARARGSSRRSRARTRWRSWRREGAALGAGGPVLVCLSGRGDKDVDAVGRGPGPGWLRGRPRARRIRAAFAEAGRPLFMPYVMGGYPDLAASAEHAAAAWRARRHDRARHPVLRPAGRRARRSRPPASGRLENGTRPEDVIEIAEGLRGGPPVVLMTYVNVVLAAGSARVHGAGGARRRRRA